MWARTRITRDGPRFHITFIRGVGKTGTSEYPDPDGNPRGVDLKDPKIQDDWKWIDAGIIDVLEEYIDEDSDKMSFVSFIPSGYSVKRSRTVKLSPDDEDQAGTLLGFMDDMVKIT